MEFKGDCLNIAIEKAIHELTCFVLAPDYREEIIELISKAITRDIQNCFSNFLGHFNA